jgi:hypothetical protein
MTGPTLTALSANPAARNAWPRISHLSSVVSRPSSVVSRPSSVAQLFVPLRFTIIFYSIIFNYPTL